MEKLVISCQLKSLRKRSSKLSMEEIKVISILLCCLLCWSWHSDLNNRKTIFSIFCALHTSNENFKYKKETARLSLHCCLLGWSWHSAPVERLPLDQQRFFCSDQASCIFIDDVFCISSALLFVFRSHFHQLCLLYIHRSCPL